MGCGKSWVECKELNINNVLSIKRIGAAKMNRTLQKYENTKLLTFFYSIPTIIKNLGNDMIFGYCYE